ncbi:MAG TPA: error-prone DNA polymerase [Steroidobacteraceae bacterium]|jgi:error-prone DNA polymerase|nr:error-prone DNA polymerase [Steroidobacteraceae bacterium]
MYAELHALSNFSFLRGASQPEELVEQAKRLGYCAMALTDECSLAGVVRAHVAAKKQGLPLIIGTELTCIDGLKLVALATDRASYGAMSRLISRARRAHVKGRYALGRADLEDALDGCLIIWLPHAGRGSPPRHDEDGRWLRERFQGRLWIGVELLTSGFDMRRLETLEALGKTLQLPSVAAGDVHMHRRSRRALQDVLTAIRLGKPLQAAGYAVFPNGERCLRPVQRLRELYPAPLLAQTLKIAERCTFSLEELRYEYPEEIVPAGATPGSHLHALTMRGCAQRWPAGVPPAVRANIEHELRLIAELKFEPFFLTVHDVVQFARSQGILCQGRGSAANSTVCYCLGITEVDPSRMAMLFERFISKERNEPPDIDVDFEHERREEVIQYVYGKYGRERAALAATVICYRPRSALRDVGKALGLDLAQVDKLARGMQWWDGQRIDPDRIRASGFDPEDPVIARLIALAAEILGFPRHLSQHVGGFVIARGRLDELVPIENAAMPDRTVIEWDKDDLDALGLLKVDVLGLGMLSALRRTFQLVNEFGGSSAVAGHLGLATVPGEDAAVYAMICRADTTGVFQIESRAQMSMLPRLRPQNYYDLVIEVAIVRPGPIQGEMVHPYLRRRSGEEAVTYPSKEVEAVLKRTLGVPIFQEQVMQLAIVAAGFSPGEADRLRRAMAAWKRKGGLEPFQRQLIDGMRERGYPDSFAHQIFNQILGFGEYGFPESHAASFALLVYTSAWLKHYEPAAFCAALVNSQPMGFYAPAQLVRDARSHGVEVRAVDAASSDWDCTLERRDDGHPALRLGLRLVKHLSSEGAARLLAARAVRAFDSIADLAERGGLTRHDLEALADADALSRLAGHRHHAMWQVTGVERVLPLLSAATVPAEGIPLLRAPREGQDIVADYGSTGLTLRRHPLCLLREKLRQRGVLQTQDLWEQPNGKWVRTAGLVITRQRPGSAGGVTFVTMEDETGYVNLIVWNRVAEEQRAALLESRLLEVQGQVQREGDVQHVIARRLTNLSAMLGDLTVASRNFH